MIIDTLRALAKTKENLGQLQIRYMEDRKLTYPSIENLNTDSLISKIETEIELCLSSSVINKSGRFKIPYKEDEYTDKVILTRSPGLKREYASYSAFKMNLADEIKKDDVILKAQFRGQPVKMRLSVLRNESKIDQRKLDKYFEFLKSFIEINKKLENFIHEDSYYSRKKKANMIMVNKIGIGILSQHFYLHYQESGRQKDDTETIESTCIQDFSNMDESGSKNSYTQNLNDADMKLIVDRYPELHKTLLVLDKKKEKMCNKINALLKLLKKENTAFRVLQKLSQ